MKTKLIKGFCPSLEEPIKASDGLLFRIRPHMDYLDIEKLVYLCNLSIKYGSGIMELTNRGSIQIRGIREKYHKFFLNQILTKKIVKKKISVLSSNIIINPLWEHNDQNYKVYNKIIQLESQLPKLPNKFGFIIDLGKKLSLKNVSADIRVESASNQKILIRADGASKGKIIQLSDLDSFVLEIVNWFIENKEKNINRMSELLAKKKLPNKWTQNKPICSVYKFLPKNSKIGQILGIKLGRFKAKDLKCLVLNSKASRIRFTPFKMIVLEKAFNIKDKEFIFKADEPLLNISACSGINFCSSATIDTFKLAKKIKNPLNKKIHIAGCKKNCGTNRNTEIVLSGNDSRVDVSNNFKKKKNLGNFTFLEISRKIF